MENKKYDLATLPPTTLRILIEFYRINKKDGDEIKISVDKIAERLKVAKSTFRQHIKLLEDNGFLSSQENFDELGRHTPKSYFIKLPFGEFIQGMFNIQVKKHENPQNNQPQNPPSIQSPNQQRHNQWMQKQHMNKKKKNNHQQNNPKPHNK